MSMIIELISELFITIVQSILVLLLTGIFTVSLGLIPFAIVNGVTGSIELAWLIAALFSFQLAFYTVIIEG